MDQANIVRNMERQARQACLRRETIERLCWYTNIWMLGRHKIRDHTCGIFPREIPWYYLFWAGEISSWFSGNLSRCPAITWERLQCVTKRHKMAGRNMVGDYYFSCRRTVGFYELPRHSNDGYPCWSDIEFIFMLGYFSKRGPCSHGSFLDYHTARKFLALQYNLGFSNYFLKI